MNVRRLAGLRPFEHLALWGTLAMLVFYSYGFLFYTPYAGFNFENADGTVTRLYLSGGQLGDLQVGDRLIQVGDVDMAEFTRDITLPIFVGAQAGDEIDVLVERNGQTMDIAYIYPGRTRVEFLERLPSQWWLAFAFWLWGALTMVWVRPHDARWRLMLAFNFVMALFWAAGNGSGHWHYGYSAYLVRGLIWLVPLVYLHLNWEFPTPLYKLPKTLWTGLYGLVALFMLAQILDWLPFTAALLALLAGLAGSVAFVFLHIRRHTGSARTSARLLGYVSFLAVLPAVLAGVGVAMDALPSNAFAGGLLALPLLPGVYFYALARSRLGGLELRATQVVVSITYLTLTLAGAVLLALAAALLGLGSPGLAAIFFAFFGALAALALYPRYERWFQARYLGMPLPPEGLERQYAAQITTSLDIPALLDTLCGKVLPSLLIRQSALLRRTPEGHWRPIYNEGVPPEDLALTDPDAHLSPLGAFRPKDPDTPDAPLGWVRLALPLRIGGELTGLWLLGRRDPDDHYHPLELDFFQHLADQTALALVNIDQSAQLRALYQANVDNHERERERLAHDLHDDILNRLALLLPEAHDPGLVEELQGLIASLRQTVTGLRPAMLTYGLQTALDELTDILEDRPGLATRIEFDIPPTSARFDPAVELHFFRIVQQACENALRHAQANTLGIRGRIEAEQVELYVEDDGRGFVPEKSLNLVELLQGGHFGLAGMLERAGLVGADLQIHSAPGAGTRISILWEPKPS
ncbi:MAG: hypothetical protein HYZ26_01985 [Chloroflexi bacterium]|nr:hypothetical protein [Chloroflexota bacterium]